VRLFILAFLLLILAAQARAEESMDWALPDAKAEASKEKFQQLKTQAEAGETGAQFELANLYFTGAPDIKLEQDLNMAAELYYKAAESGNTEAQYRLGTMYMNGYGRTQNYEEAGKLFRKAANQGHVRAQYDLASMLLKGIGTTEDYSEAYFWLLLADKGKHPEALAALPKVQQALEPDVAQAMGELARNWKPGDSK
jgi:TPR repeat protein